MNRILIMLVLFVFPPSFALAESVTMDDLVERGGLTYKKFTQVPFTGEVMDWMRGEFVDGKRNGPWVTYREDGQIISKNVYKNGELDGTSTVYHGNGKLWV